MKFASVILCAVSLAACAAPMSPMSPRDAQWSECASPVPDRQIAACTAIIAEAKEKPINMAGAYNNRANAYFALAKFEEAIRDYDLAVQLNPDYFAGFNNRANVYREMGSFERALKDYDRALAIAPSYAAAHLDTGITYLMMKKPDITIAESTFVLRREPKNAKALYSRGLAKRMKGQDGNSDIAEARGIDSQVAVLFTRLKLAS